MNRAARAFARTRGYLGELGRFGGGSLLMLGIKLGLLQLGQLFLGSLVAYALAQVVVFFLAYLWHSRITFGAPYSWHGLREYFQVIAVFQLLDYLIFTVIFTRFEVRATLVVLMSTAVVFFIRFLCVRWRLKGQDR